MKVKLLLAPLLCLLLMVSCKEKQYIVGYYNYAQFQKDCHWDYFVDEKYQARERWADSLASLNDPDSVRLQLFLGCYCGDSRKWVSRFYALKPQLPVSSVEIISVDTTKKDEKGYAEAVGIKKIPTFIFYKGSTEIGRIVEKPKGRLEKRLYEVLKKRE
ncbi:MAG: thioredoxin family protein [Bacteroidota bacterium]